MIFSQVKSDISRLGGTTAESWVASRTWHALRACQALPSSETRLARCWCTTQLYAPSLAVSVSVADVTSPRLLPTFALHVPWQLPYQLPLSLTPTGCRFCCVRERVERRRALAVGSGAFDCGRPVVYIHNVPPASPGHQLRVHPARARFHLGAAAGSPLRGPVSASSTFFFSALPESSTSSTPAPPLLPPLPPRLTRVGATRSPSPRPSLLAHLGRRHDDVSVQVGAVHCERPGRVVGDGRGAHALSVSDRRRGHVVVRAVQGQAVAAR